MDISEKIIVVIPCYNHENSIEDVIKGVKKHINNLVVVNDGSTDSSAKKAEKQKIDLININPNQGKGKAIIKGLNYAKQKGYDYILTIDADMQHNPDDIPEFISKINQNPASLIVGVRDYSGEFVPWTSKAGGKISHTLTTFISKTKIPDSTCGYRIYPVEPFYNYNFISSRYEFENEILLVAAKNGIKIVPFPVKVVYPQVRITHYRLYKDSFRILKLLWYYRKNS